jgi:hypothetical protein
MVVHTISKESEIVNISFHSFLNFAVEKRTWLGHISMLDAAQGVSADRLGVAFKDFWGAVSHHTCETSKAGGISYSEKTHLNF